MTALTHDRVREIAGPLTDAQIARILASEAREEDLLAAVAWLIADDAIGQERQQQAAGKVGELCEILLADESPEEEAAPGRMPGLPE